MGKVKAFLGSLAAAIRSTVSCTIPGDNVIDDEDEDNFMADNAKDGGASESGQGAFVEIDLLRSDRNRQRNFPDNSFRTAKYTLLTALPLSLLYQFYKISNIYFLLVMIIALVPGASPINPFSSIVPLSFVIGAGIFKDLWEDCKRRRADRQANEMTVYVLRACAEVSSNGSAAASAAATSSGSGTPTGKQNSTSGSDGAAAAPLCVHGGHDHQQSLRRWRQRVVRVVSRPSSPRDGTAVSRNKSYDGERVHAMEEAEMTTYGRSCGASTACPMALSLRRTSAPPQESATPDAATEPVVTFQPVRSCEVHPGDIMLFRLGEEVKADCLILNTSLPDGLAYIETANLDGETNAKTRRAKIQTVEALGTVEDVVEKALGVSPSNAAAVHARMNGIDTGPQDVWGMSCEAAAPAKVRVDCCDAFGGAHAVSTPERWMNASVRGTAATDAKRLDASLTTTSPAALGKGLGRSALSAKTAAAKGGDMVVHTAISESSVPQGGLHDYSPQRQHNSQRPVGWECSELKAAEHDSAAATAERGAAPLRHQNESSFSDQQKHFASISATGIPLAHSSADLSAAMSGNFHTVASNVTSDMSPERILHQRLMTLQERLAEEGQLAMPLQLRQLSEHYERTVHSRTNSAGTRVSSLHVYPHNSTNRAGESKYLLDDAAEHHHRSRESPQWRVPEPRRCDGAGDAETAATQPGFGASLCGRSRGFSAPDKFGVFHNEPLHDNRIADGSNRASDAASGVVLISCPPTPDLSMWFGQLRLPSGEMVPLGIDQFIPRGCIIRNTEWVIGVVVYTGRHTKMLLNLRPKPHKVTNMTRRLNQMNMLFFAFSQVLILLLCGLAIWSKRELLRKVPGAKTDHSAWYIQWNLERYSDVSLFWWRYLTNFVLVSYLIPLSLYVTLEFNKAMQMLLIGADKRMAVFDEFTGVIKRARPKTSELNGQLGHVRYIFTDKTGTLTENLMTYVGGVVDGLTHNETEQPGGLGRALLRRSTAYTAGNVLTSVCPNSMGSSHESSLRCDHHKHLRLNSSLGREASTLGDAAVADSVAGMQDEVALVSPHAAANNTGSCSAAGGGDQHSPTHTFQRLVAVMATHIASDAHAGGDGDKVSQSPRTVMAASPATLVATGDIGATSPQPPHLPLSNSYQCGSGTFGGNTFPGLGSAAPGAVGNEPGVLGSAVGLRNISEAVLEREPLFCYLRAIALCHSVVCFPVDAVNGVADSQHVAEKGNGAPQETKGHKDRRRDKDRNATAAAGEGSASLKRKSNHRHYRHHNRADDRAGKGAPRRRRGSTSTADPDPSRGHHQQSHETARHTPDLVPLSNILSLNDISVGNFVEIPYAVPAGPAVCENFEPYTASGTNGGRSLSMSTHDHLTRANTTPFLTAAASTDGRGQHQYHHRQTNTNSIVPASTTMDLGLLTKGIFNLSRNNTALLHGRTSSTSWYQNRYFNRAMHNRNLSAHVSHDGGERNPTHAASPSTTMYSPGSAGEFAEEAATRAEAGESAAPVAASDLEPFIDRSKIYEGQSLDEIALVNAARENGFSLFERTAKQIYIKALGRVMCYDIIAELDFTPQRKLMSILLQRRPDLDSEAAATSVASGVSAHYHRRAPESSAAAAAARDASELLAATASGVLPECGVASRPPQSQSHDGLCAFPAQGKKTNGDSAASSLPGGDARLCQTKTTSVFATLTAAELLLPLSRPFTVVLTSEARKSTAEQGEEEDGNRSADGPAAKMLPPHSILLPPPTKQQRVPHLGSSSVFTATPTLNSTQQVAYQPSGGDMSSYHDGFGSSAGFGLAAAAGAPASAPGKYLLLVKGADSSMMEIVNMQKRANVRVKNKMLKELDAMSQMGLRTLILGQRYLREEEVRGWLPVFNDAQCAMQDRSEKLHKAYALVEKDIDIVGVTAVEDKLQEEVPQTLEFCIQASIVVWMLTGDKRETAVTIAHTSGLVKAGYTDYVCHLDVSDIIEEEALLRQKQRYKETCRRKVKDGSGDGASSLESVSSSSSDADNAFHSPVASTTTRAHLSGSSRTHSLQLPKALAQAGSVDCATVASTASPLQETANRIAGGDSIKAETSIPVDAAQSFLMHKCARIEEQLKAAEERCSEGQEVLDGRVVVIVVDGKTLDFIFEDCNRAHRFFLLGSRCRSAVCCRMTPLQKAKVVRMFKRNANAVVLAIGDGANDVSMIQESSIGVGIMGLEGSQAELASDYALPKFRFLKRLLFVHGRFSVFREGHCVVYSLYKNVIVTVGMVGYQFYAGYSGQTLIDSWLLGMFSVFLCSLQPLMIGILDKDVEDELAESLPRLYPPLSRESMYFSCTYIIKWLIDGLMEGLIFFFFLMYTVGVQDNLYTYMTAAIEDYGATFFTMLVLVADLRAGTLVTYYMLPFALVIGLAIILVPTLEFAYAALHDLAGSNWFVYVANELYGTSGKFWLMLFFACGVFVIFTMASNMYIQLFAPWHNAGFAMRAAHRSNHRVPYQHTKEELKAEYARLLARYEELTKLQQQQKESAAKKSGAKGKTQTTTTAAAAAR
ncbi:putative phospholipid transporting ATPase-like protein [Leishmania major strain Friedlin]|uniref:Putative phospholipid transporting ATPase-like protein n=1 Tax=Leishmania major TaxID=5664 RepID=Q4QHT5_LEIMA|nr:putative phospholipid transporting ATPase-like protein [Leishmania major strain Friedlin]CAG9569704.1 phospholipid_transporting_ATPase-like_protein_-__putative [Leishmania major strain Friedlin]CAJ02767.1 putative phospholipid transporting ATPase-like protein [Leishmania major strain Friedlin]|eukprot:XP_001681263.1 putative phospholipid transporting ATPase-like protein [Leishmania major strain Friedlin]